MSRYNEEDPYNAGANFIKAALDIGFKDRKKLVYTGTKSIGIKKIKSKGIDPKKSNIIVTHDKDVARNFAQY